MSVAKVVRVEEVEQDGQGNPSRSLSHVNSSVSIFGRDSSLYSGSTRTPKTDSTSHDVVLLDGDIELADEAKDKVYELPDNWPRITPLFRRRSCQLTASVIPCVNKAVSHLELIQNIIEEWFKQNEDDIKSQLSSRVGGRSVQSSLRGRKHLRFTTDEDKDNVASQRTASHAGVSRGSSASTSSSLSIKGVGATADKDAGLDIPFLGAEDVIDEVITLLARLDNDKMETLKALDREKQRCANLNGKIDVMRLQRMKELPVLVQREHEACIMDLNELQWHVAYASRNETRIKGRTEIAEVLNMRLKEDIAFVKRHIPLVKEKLELELEAMHKIKSAQDETDSELYVTKDRKSKTQQKSSEAQNKADVERGHIKKELDNVRDNLNHISEEFSAAKMLYNSYIHQINDIKQQLTDNEQELQVLQVKNDNAKTAEALQSAKVKDLQQRIAEAEANHQQFEAENERLEQQLKIKKHSFAEQIMQLERVVAIKEEKLRQITLRNQEASMEIQDSLDKIDDCRKQKVADEKNVVRIKKEMIRTEGLMSVTMEEHKQVTAINNAIKDQLKAEQDKAYRTEESLKATVETLRRQVKDEMHTRTVLQARITSDTTEIKKSRDDNKGKREKPPEETEIQPQAESPEDKVKNVARDIEAAVKAIMEKVSKLRQVKEQKNEMITDFKKKLEETRKQHKESEETFNKKLEQMVPHHTHLKGDLLNINKQVDHMDWKTELMTKKMEDMEASSGMMTRSIANTEKLVQALESNLNELNLQLEAGHKMEDDLKSSLEEVTNRIKENDSRHTAFMQERQDILKQLEDDKKNSLIVNKDLASKYRQNQNDNILFKEKLLNKYEEKIKLENALKDVRQLQSLQVRMHDAMQEYFKIRGLFNQSELSRFEYESSANAAKVTDLQGSMDEALKMITDFLQNQMDGNAARKVAWQTLKQTPRESVATPSRLTRSKQTPLRV